MINQSSQPNREDFVLIFAATRIAVVRKTKKTAMTQLAMIRPACESMGRGSGGGAILMPFAGFI